MSADVPSSVDVFIQGEKEPASSGIVLVLGFVTMLSFLVLYGILFPCLLYTSPSPRDP